MKVVYTDEALAIEVLYIHHAARDEARHATSDLRLSEQRRAPMGVPSSGVGGFCEILERAKGLEPSTPTLARSCSTTELHPRPKALAAIQAPATGRAMPNAAR
jgi:hypothetical protein